MAPKKGDNAAKAAAEAAAMRAAAEAASQRIVAVETNPEEPTLEKKVSDLQTATRDAVERLDVVDERLDELENKGDRVQEEIQGLLDETVDRIDQQDNALKDEIDSLKKVVRELAQQSEAQLLERIKEGLGHDPVAETLIGYAKEGKSRRYWLEGGLLYTRGNRLYIPQFGNLRKHLMKESHDSKWAGHPGIHRTTALLADQYYWPHMGRDVEAYVKTCLVCQQDKVEAGKPMGLLQPLPIPERPWESISMDFIIGLPKVDDFSSIMVVVDRFSKYATFIPASKVCPAEEAARLFLKHVVKYWGVPKKIVSDRDTRFTGRFWTELFKLLGSNLNFSTSFHPQTDGQTERGQPTSEGSWEPAEALWQFEDKVADYHARAATRASLNQVGENVTGGRPMTEVHTHQGPMSNPKKLFIQTSPLGECQKGKSKMEISQLQFRDSLD
ncbi:hypothetical protein GQ457_15G008210 [Hibiscus cannabinus]